MGDTFKSYDSIHTEAELRSLVAKHLGSETIELERQNVGEVNAVYFATLQNQTSCVIRIAPLAKGYNAFEEESWLFSQCKNAGVPVPHVLAVNAHPMDFPEGYMITQRIEGISADSVNLSQEQKVEILHQVGHYLSLIHSVKIEGFGNYEKVDGGFKGQHNSLYELLQSETREAWWVKDVAKYQLLSPKEIEEVQNALEKEKELFTLEKASITHGDISFGNTIIQGTKVVGIVDMENSVAADPIFDFRVFKYWDTEENRKALMDGYSNKAIFDENFERKLLFYELLYAMKALVYNNSRGFNDRTKVGYEKIQSLKKQLEISTS